MSMTGVVIAGVSGGCGFPHRRVSGRHHLHGVSCGRKQAYLFLNRPNLPVNGVTLTDISQRTDKGHITIVDLDITRNGH